MAGRYGALKCLAWSAPVPALRMSYAASFLRSNQRKFNAGLAIVARQFYTAFDRMRAVLKRPVLVANGLG